MSIYFSLAKLLPVCILYDVLYYIRMTNGFSILLNTVSKLYKAHILKILH